MGKTKELLKENIANLVFCSALLENIDITLHQVEKLILEEGGAKDDVGDGDVAASDDTRKLTNFKKALEFLAEQSSYPVELGTLIDYNRIVGESVLTHPNPGHIRDNMEVHISGCCYTAPPISQQDALELVNKHRSFLLCEERFAYLAVSVPKAQMFYDGNKRTTLLACNHLLCHEDAAKLFVLASEEECRRYVSVLIDHYEDKISLEEAMNKVMAFLQ